MHTYIYMYQKLQFELILSVQSVARFAVSCASHVNKKSNSAFIYLLRSLFFSSWYLETPLHKKIAIFYCHSYLATSRR